CGLALRSPTRRWVKNAYPDVRIGVPIRTRRLCGSLFVARGCQRESGGVVRIAIWVIRVLRGSRGGCLVAGSGPGLVSTGLVVASACSLIARSAWRYLWVVSTCS